MGFFLTERFYLKLILHVNMRPQTPKGEVGLGSVHVLAMALIACDIAYSRYGLLVLSQGKPTGKDFEGSEVDRGHGSHVLSEKSGLRLLSLGEGGG